MHLLSLYGKTFIIEGAFSGKLVEMSIKKVNF